MSTTTSCARWTTSTRRSRRRMCRSSSAPTTSSTRSPAPTRRARSPACRFSTSTSRAPSSSSSAVCRPGSPVSRNPLFAADNTVMLFADGKRAVLDLIDRHQGRVGGADPEATYRYLGILRALPGRRETCVMSKRKLAKTTPRTPAPSPYIVSPVYDCAFFLLPPTIALCLGILISGSGIRQPILRVLRPGRHLVRTADRRPHPRICSQSSSAATATPRFASCTHIGSARSGPAVRGHGCRRSGC